MTHTTHDEGITRRQLGRRAVQAGAATVMAPSLMSVATADTTSGNVELSTTATVPSSTSIEITVYEDTTGDGTADRQESATIPDGSTTTEYDLLQSSVAQGDVLWCEVALSTSDSAVTPSLDSATLTLPETPTEPTTTTSEPIQEPDDPQSLTELWNNYLAFVAAVVLGVAGLTGVMSRSLAVGAWTGYLAFVYIGLTSGTPLFRNIALVTMVLVFLGSMFKLVRLEFEGED